MSCHTPKRPNPPLADVMLAASVFNDMEPDTPVSVVSYELNNFKRLLWDLLTLSPDPNSYTAAWNTVDTFTFASARLYAYANGNREALTLLKAIVAQSVVVLP